MIRRRRPEGWFALAFAVAGCGGPTCPEPGDPVTIVDGSYQLVSANADFLGKLVPPGGLPRAAQQMDIDREAGVVRVSYVAGGHQIVETYAMTARPEP